jgi:transcriptional regulator with XRE-family HTH domain
VQDEEEEEEEEFANLGERLQYARENAGYSRPELARIARLDYWTVLRAEHGKSSPRAATLRSLAKTLGVSVQAFALYPQNGNAR